MAKIRKRNKKYTFVKLKKIKSLIVVFVFFLVIGLPFFGAILSSGDGGMISFYKIPVYEPGQKAIISWNGEQEIMILSVDVYSENSTKALHMVPFPSLPQVELGTLNSFEKINELTMANRYIYKGMGWDGVSIMSENSAIEIVFNEKVGPHNITAVKINSSQDFSLWVNEFLSDKGITDLELPDDLDLIIDNYIKQNITYFVFDIIDLNVEEKSVDPIIYKFDTEYLFFPLEISSIIEGKTKITLALITPPNLPINIMPLQKLGFYRGFDKIISKSDLYEISEKIAEIFNDNGYLELFTGYFSLPDLKNDVVVKRLNDVNWMINENSQFHNFQINDLNFDGNYEISFTTDDKLYIYNAVNGQLRHQSKLNKVNKIGNNLLLTDIDNDGISDIIVASKNRICAFNGLNKEELWDISIDVGYNGYPNIRDWNIDGISNLIVNTHYFIYLLDIKTGEKIWSCELIEEYKDNMRFIYVDDINNDKILDPMIIDDKYNLIVVNGRDGLELWQKKLPFRIRDIKVCDIATDPGLELLCYSGIDFYIFNSINGNLLWDSKDLSYNYYPKKHSRLIDVDNDNKFEILIYDYSNIHIMDGNNGTHIKNISFNHNPQRQFYDFKIEVLDFNLDNKNELIININEKLYIMSLTNGSVLWEFTTGEDISNYEIADIDNDDLSELIIITDNNKLYQIEFNENVLFSHDKIEKIPIEINRTDNNNETIDIEDKYEKPDSLSQNDYSLSDNKENEYENIKPKKRENKISMILITIIIIEIILIIAYFIRKRKKKFIS